jgi:glycosyltransferase involved in cell wall biosynthesis
MKIILFFTYGISLLDWKNTGLITRELKFYEKLYEKYGISTILLTYGDSLDIEIVKNKDFIEVVPIYTILKFDKNKYLRIARSFILPFKLKKIISDVHILKTNQLLGAWVAVICKLVYKKPLIVRTGYDLLTFSKENKKNSFKLYFYKQLTKVSLKYSNIYLVTSSVDKDKLGALCNKYAKKIKVRPNWVEVTNSKDFYERYENKLVSVGRLEKQKNYSFLIDKLYNSELRLDIYGEGTEEENLTKLSKSLNVKLTIKNPINNNLLLQELLKYKIFVSSSNFEGNPKGILEAMASGCVVIAKDNINISEIIENNHNGLIYQNDDDLISIINSILKDKNEWVRISSNAINSINTSNSLNAILDHEYSDYVDLNYSQSSFGV